MKKQAKKTLTILVTAFCIIGSLFLIYQSVFTDSNIPKGYTTYEENYDPNSFMDWTHFCWYQYESADKVDLPKTYQQVLESDIDDITGYFDDTRKCLEAGVRLDEYSFDPACIDSNDGWFLTTSEGEPRGSGVYEKYDNYTLYFFDKESARLYYICNNF